MALALPVVVTPVTSRMGALSLVRPVHMLFDKAIADDNIYYLVFHSIVNVWQLTFRANHLAKRILVATLGNFFRWI